jgi:hypothetical protein
VEVSEGDFSCDAAGGPRVTISLTWRRVCNLGEKYGVDKEVHTCCFSLSDFCGFSSSSTSVGVRDRIDILCGYFKIKKLLKTEYSCFGTAKTFDIVLFTYRC